MVYKLDMNVTSNTVNWRPRCSSDCEQWTIAMQSNGVVKA